MKRTIHIFLASSITDLSIDREAIGNFINTLNNIYNIQDLFIHLHKCEDESEDHTYIEEGTQKCLDDEIRDSDFCFVVFWHKVGNITERELRVALEAFHLKANPKVVIYFKNLAEGELPSEDIRRIMKEIDIDLKLYHREYAHIDSLKLGIITQLQKHGFMRMDMKVENKQILVSGQKVVSTENIPIYAQNEKYNELLEKCHIAEKKCSKLFKEYQQNKDKASAFYAYNDAVNERDRLQKALQIISNRILNIGSNIVEAMSNSVSSERIRKAIQCFDSGDYDGVLDLLRPEEIIKGFIETDIKEECVNMERQNYLTEYRWRISALEAKGRWEEVQNSYEEITEVVETRPTAPKTIMLEHVKYLYRQKKYEKSLDIALRLQTALEKYPSAISEEETAELFDLQGELYYSIQQYKEAEKALLKAIEKYREILSPNQEFAMKVAGIYVKLAKVYFEDTRYFEAEKLYMKSLDLYKKYDTEAIEAVDVDIAQASMELGNLYYMINRHEDARKLFNAAYLKYYELFNNGGRHYMSNLANASNSIARLDIAVFSHRVAERYYVQALKVKQLLTQQDPVAYYLFLVRICKKLGVFWKENGNSIYGDLVLQETERITSVIEEKKYANEKEEFRSLDYDYYKQPIDKSFIESLLQESVRHYKVLADENPEAYEPSLAQTYNVTGYFYSQIGEQKKAESYYVQAIEIRERMVNREVAMKPELAETYSNLAQHFCIFGNFKRAEDYALDAIKIYKKSQGETDAFNKHLARIYNYLGNIYAGAGNSQRAEDSYKESIMLYIELYEKSSRAYIDRIINIVNNIVFLLDPMGRSKWMEEFVDEDKVRDWLPCE